MTPENEAIAFRIWQFANPIGWDCLVSDVARGLGLEFGKVNRIVTVKGWNRRFRTSKCSIDRTPTGGIHLDLLPYKQLRASLDD